MQLLNILLSLGEDHGNQVPKYGVTPSEIAVLRLIHGSDSVTDIEVVGEVKRSNREERERLVDRYSRAQPNGPRRAAEVDSLFPGAAARLFEEIDELELPEEFFKTVARASTKRTKADPLDHDGDGKKGGSKPKRVEKTETTEQITQQDADAPDGIEEMDDKLFA